MSLTLSAAYFPPAGYLREAMRAENIRIEAFETYPKQTYRNRCLIGGPNGLQTLVVPVVKPDGNRTKTKDVRISAHEPWQKIHRRSIETAYNNSPFFLYYQDYFTPVFEKRFEFLIDLDMAILEALFRLFGITAPLSLTVSFEREYPDDQDLRFLSEKKTIFSEDLLPPYPQVFDTRHGFIPGLSAIDLLFNLGPEAREFLLNAE